MTGRDERGVATVLATSMMGLLLSVTLAVGCAISVVAAHRVAESAADLASLAGASALRTGEDPCARAALVARRNRGEVVVCTVVGWDVSVVVRARARLPIGEVTLSARGRAGPVPA